MMTSSDSLDFDEEGSNSMMPPITALTSDAGTESICSFHCSSVSPFLVNASGPSLDAGDEAGDDSSSHHMLTSAS